MSGRTPSLVWVWLAVVGAAAVGLLFWEVSTGQPPALSDWLKMAVLASGAAVSFLFPIYSNFTMFRSTSVRLTNVFLVAGVVLLPASLMAFLPALAFAPEVIRDWRKPGALRRWAFNAAQTTVAMQAAVYWLRLWSWIPGALGQVVVVLGAISVITAVQAALVAVVIALNSGIPLRKVDTWSGPHLLSALLVNLLGVMLGRIWRADPVMAGLMPVMVYLTHGLVRSAHLAYLGTVDPKTGVYTYKYFLELLVAEVDRCQRRRRPLALLFADLDFMRRVNNEYGHLAGDQVLSEVAGIVAQAVGTAGSVGRFGGEEFVMVLPNMNAAAAGQTAETIRRRVEGHTFHVGPKLTTSCTVSIGVAAMPEHASTWEALVDKADMAMYRAKERRNAVVLSA